MELLQQFNANYHMKDALKAYFIEYFERQIIERARKGEDIKALAEAINELDGAFKRLEQDFNVGEQPKQTINQAR